jgi:hypothetical protein
MKSGFRIIVSLLFFLFLMAPLLAHHSVAAQFDASKVTTVSGVVTKIEWSNPHVWIYMDVKTGNQTVPWRVQIAAVNALTNAGFSRDLLDFSAPITLQVWPAFTDAKDYKTGNGRELKLPDGRKFDVSDKWPEGSNKTALPGTR